MAQAFNGKVLKGELRMGQRNRDIYIYALRRLRDPELAKVFVHETFLSALKQERGTDELFDEHAWLMGSLKARILDHFCEVFEKKPFSALEENEMVIDSFFDHEGRHIKIFPEERIRSEKISDKEDFWTIFFSCLWQMPEAVGEAFYLREIECMDAQEICAVLNVNFETLHRMLLRARLQMCDALEPRLLKDVSAFQATGKVS